MAGGRRAAGWILQCPGPCPMITTLSPSLPRLLSVLAITFLCPGPRLLLWGKINIKMEASPSPNVRRIAMPARTFRCFLFLLFLQLKKGFMYSLLNCYLLIFPTTSPRVIIENLMTSYPYTFFMRKIWYFLLHLAPFSFSELSISLPLYSSAADGGTARAKDISNLFTLRGTLSAPLSSGQALLLLLVPAALLSLFSRCI